jgi:hypothetical protein
LIAGQLGECGELRRGWLKDGTDVGASVAPQY